jgi:hypothetical protein
MAMSISWPSAKLRTTSAERVGLVVAVNEVAVLDHTRRAKIIGAATEDQHVVLQLAGAGHRFAGRLQRGQADAPGDAVDQGKPGQTATAQRTTQPGGQDQAGAAVAGNDDVATVVVSASLAAFQQQTSRYGSVFECGYERFVSSSGCRRRKEDFAQIAPDQSRSNPLERRQWAAPTA